MAPIRVSAISFLLVSSLLIAAAQASNELKQTNMTLYLQSLSAGPNATVIPVAGIQGKAWSMYQFGTISVSDDPITVGPDFNSAPVGRAQGLHVIASSDGSIITQAMISFVFTNKAYNGSTLGILGIHRHSDAVREGPVVSGTGKFRHARGYAEFDTYFANVTTGYSIMRCNLSVIHY